MIADDVQVMSEGPPAGVVGEEVIAALMRVEAAQQRRDLALDTVRASDAVRKECAASLHWL